MASDGKVVELRLPTPPKAEPNAALVEALEEMVRMAKVGELRSFVGTGITADQHGNPSGTYSCFYVVGAPRLMLYGAVCELQHRFLQRYPDSVR